VWPLDVVKSQLQSGRFAGRSYLQLLRGLATNSNGNGNVALAYRGLAPGLLRSFVANGCSMVVYRRVLQLLKEMREKEKERES
jgi:hypothetical protein